MSAWGQLVGRGSGEWAPETAAAPAVCRGSRGDPARPSLEDVPLRHVCGLGAVLFQHADLPLLWPSAGLTSGLCLSPVSCLFSVLFKKGVGAV